MSFFSLTFLMGFFLLGGNMEMQASALGNFLHIMGELFLICRVTKYVCLAEDFIFLPRGFVRKYREGGQKA